MHFFPTVRLAKAITKQSMNVRVLRLSREVHPIELRRSLFRLRPRCPWFLRLQQAFRCRMRTSSSLHDRGTIVCDRYVSDGADEHVVHSSSARGSSGQFPPRLWRRYVISLSFFTCGSSGPSFRMSTGTPGFLVQTFLSSSFDPKNRKPRGNGISKVYPLDKIQTTTIVEG